MIMKICVQVCLPFVSLCVFILSKRVRLSKQQHTLIRAYWILIVRFVALCAVLNAHCPN